MLFGSETYFSVALGALLSRSLRQREEGSMAQSPVSGILGGGDGSDSWRPPPPPKLWLSE